MSFSMCIEVHGLSVSSQYFFVFVIALLAMSDHLNSQHIFCDNCFNILLTIVGMR